MTTYSETFPSTAEEFINGAIIPDFLTRGNTAYWLARMDSAYPNQLNPDLKYFSATLRYSYEKTRDLYQIQSNYNIQDGKSPDVKKDDFYYSALFKSHELWTDIIFEMKRISDVIVKDDWQKPINLQEGEWFILLSYVDGTLPNRLEQLKINADNISEFIQQAPTALNT